ncbi:hypothetical protein L7F22_027962 [Adiantum nelumboides]|nr:hypothetical protein [Adiantum nelumboides]
MKSRPGGERRSSKGWRLALTLPLLPALFVLDAKLPFAMARQFLGFSLCWLMPIKLLLRCVDNYSLDWSRPWALSSFPRFIGSALLVISPKVNGPACSSRWPWSVLGHLLRDLCLVMACLQTLLYLHPENPNPLHYPFHFFLFILTMTIPAHFATLLLRLDLRPSFNQPLRSQSISEFWGQRWSLTASALLRELVYNPVLGFLQPDLLNSSTSASPSFGTTEPPANQSVALWKRVTAVCSTFFVSGLLHELTWFCTVQGRNAPSWEVFFFFFLLHGVLNSAEICLRRLHPQLVSKTPAYLKLLLTQIFVHVSFGFLFFGPLVTRGHLQMEVLTEYTALRVKFQALVTQVNE